MENPQEPEEKQPWRGPIRIILALFLILLTVMMIVPYYSVKLDPEPKDIPTFADIRHIVPKDIVLNATSSDILSLLDPNDPTVKLVADNIVSQACSSDEVCQAKALFYFVRDNFDYVSDPTADEYIKPAVLSLQSGGGDCDDASVLLANLLESIGIETRFVFVPGHVFVQAKIPRALKKYKFTEDWVNLDATCDNCGFGQITYKVAKQDMRYE